MDHFSKIRTISSAGNMNNQRCRWLIVAGQPGNTIEIDWTRFNWPSTSDTTCTNYFVEVRDIGPVGGVCNDGLCNTAARTERYCGKHLPPSFTSGTESVQIITSALLSNADDAPFFELNYRLRNGW